MFQFCFHTSPPQTLLWLQRELKGEFGCSFSMRLKSKTNSLNHKATRSSLGPRLECFLRAEQLVVLKVPLILTLSVIHF